MKYSRQEAQDKLERSENKPKAIKKTLIRSYIWMITLNVNGLNELNKRNRLAGKVKTNVCIYF